MNNNLNQPEQDDTQVDNPFPIIDGPLSNQGPEPSADRLHEEFKEYEEPSVPYLPLPSDNPQQPAWRTSPAAVSQAADSPSSSPPGDTTVTPPMSERVVSVLFGAILGAILGGVVAHASGGSLVVGVVVGGSIGAVVVVGVIALIQSDAWDAWEVLGGLAQFLDCCLTSAILVVASVLMIGGLLLWHSLLLVALAGASMMLMLIGLSRVASSNRGQDAGH